MLSLADVRSWNPALLNEIADEIGRRLQVLIHAGDDYATILPVEGWTGPAADTALSRHRSITSRLATLTAGASAVHKACIQAADAIPALLHTITDLDELSRRYSYQLTDTWAVSDLLAGQPLPADLHPEDRARAHQQLTDGAAATLATATDIDADLAGVLRRAAPGEISPGAGDGSGQTTMAAATLATATDPGLTLLPPPANATPSQNAAWWATMSPTAQALYLHNNPARVGNLDGLPGVVRSQANMARLPQERATLHQQLTEAQQHVQAVKDMPYRPSHLLTDALADARALEAKLESLNTIESTMAKGGRQLLTLATTGNLAKAAVAVGNVDTAQHVAVFTPGFTTTVNGSLDRYDTDMENLKTTTEEILKHSKDGGGVAAVTWIGYEAPQNADVLNGGKSVVSDDLAETGARTLTGFLNGLGATHDACGQPLHLTALGHSYGSLTTGIALQNPTPVDDAVIFGSPGMNINNVQDLHVPDGHVYSLRAEGDSVPDMNIGHHFGTSPYELPAINRLDTGANNNDITGPTTPVTGHSGYLTHGSTSQYNLATITAGQPEHQTPYTPPHAQPTPPPGPNDPIPAPPGRTPQPPR